MYVRKKKNEQLEPKDSRDELSRGLMLESRTRNPKVAGSSLGPAGIVGGGSAPRAPQHKWLPTALGVCSLLCVSTLDG